MPRRSLLQVRGGTATEWTTANPVLEDRELGLETDTRKLKAGDGTTAWADLDYLAAEAAGGITQDDLDEHAATTTSVHGIANTAVLATHTDVATAIDAIATSTGWSVNAVFSELKTFNPNDTTPTEIARVLGTLVNALVAEGLITGP